MSEKSREYLLGVSTTLAVVFAVLFVLVLFAFGDLVKRNDLLKKQLACPEQCVR